MPSDFKEKPRIIRAYQVTEQTNVQLPEKVVVANASDYVICNDDDSPALVLSEAEFNSKYELV